MGYPQTNRKIDTGKTLTRWPVFVDHFRRLISGKTQNDQDICALAKEYEIAMLLVTKGAEG
ncbi:hypothetical protein F2Y77_24250, partial [Shigella sonnei]